MNPLLADDESKNVVVYINDFYPEFAMAFKKLSERLGRPLRGVMLIDAERKANGKNLPDKEGLFEEIVVDFSDDAALSRALKPLEKNLLLVSCDSERSQLYFKKVIPHVPYVNTTTETSIDWSTNKARMREMLASYDEKITPKYVEIHDDSEISIQQILDKLSFPLILKPTNLNSSILVNRVDSEHELRQTLKKSFKRLRDVYAMYRGLGDITMVVEEFIAGDTYSIDGYVDATGKIYLLPFIHYENASMAGMTGYQVHRSETYLSLTGEEIEEGQRTAQKAIHAVGLRSSVAHIELFHTDAGWKIIELGARPGGQRQDLYETSYGVDHALNELLVKVGLQPEIPDRLEKYCETFNVYASDTGVVESLEGIEIARQHPSLHSLQVNVNPGDTVMPSIDGGKALAEGLMYNADLQQLRHDTEYVRSIIEVNLKKQG